MTMKMNVSSTTTTVEQVLTASAEDFMLALGVEPGDSIRFCSHDGSLITVHTQDVHHLLVVRSHSKKERAPRDLGEAVAMSDEAPNG